MTPEEKEVRKWLIQAYYALLTAHLGTKNSEKLTSKIYGASVDIFFLPLDRKMEETNE